MNECRERRTRRLLVIKKACKEPRMGSGSDRHCNINPPDGHVLWSFSLFCLRAGEAFLLTVTCCLYHVDPSVSRSCPSAWFSSSSPTLVCAHRQETRRANVNLCMRTQGVCWLSCQTVATDTKYRLKYLVILARHEDRLAHFIAKNWWLSWPQKDCAVCVPLFSVSLLCHYLCAPTLSIWYHFSRWLCLEAVDD